MPQREEDSDIGRPVRGGPMRARESAPESTPVEGGPMRERDVPRASEPVQGGPMREQRATDQVDVRGGPGKARVPRDVTSSDEP